MLCDDQNAGDPKVKIKGSAFISKIHVRRNCNSYLSYKIGCGYRKGGDIPKGAAHWIPTTSCAVSNGPMDVISYLSWGMSVRHLSSMKRALAN